jgi:hypothetical protein
LLCFVVIDTSVSDWDYERGTHAPGGFVLNLSCFVFVLIVVALLVRRYYVSGETTNADRNKLAACIAAILASSVATTTCWGWTPRVGAVRGARAGMAHVVAVVRLHRHQRLRAGVPQRLIISVKFAQI